jgi:RhtB (resistance to homoserine/threonine) family protein
MKEFAIIALAHLFALISPGPDTIITLKNSLKSAKHGILTSFGIGIGNLFHIIASLLGLGLIISQSVMLYSGIKFVCGIYLFYLGYKALRANIKFNLDDQLKAVENQNSTNSILEGMLNSLLNPKVTLFYFALFTQVISSQTLLEVKLFYGFYMFLATVTYFSILSVCLNFKPVKNILQKAFKPIEKITGAVLIFLGFKLITEK